MRLTVLNPLQFSNQIYKLFYQSVKRHICLRKLGTNSRNLTLLFKFLKISDEKINAIYSKHHKTIFHTLWEPCLSRLCYPGEMFLFSCDVMVTSAVFDKKNGGV